jgi:hypothetical protein
MARFTVIHCARGLAVGVESLIRGFVNWEFRKRGTVTVPA